MNLSTHVLDLARGLPARGVAVTLERHDGGVRWTQLAEARTDDDGRVRSLLPEGVALDARTYRLRFDTGAYLGDGAFYPEATIVFRVLDPKAHHHVPLLLSPFGYSTYRGS
ncbi:hydroxyisourate hydrolase [Sandaracinus amylolyticus]|uniref:5-hydroxyisourate hydrolase n=1 Tax=Sandaracinus amylolyticus TaxID=927083 RepID=A0A0F6YLG0_9BACT|nr:hydroxyisourate hydrolase [Sandaracinus amylolyticus]AKF09420.1 5-Hydroxyisourate Hydrolase [Sandaracinus amylolyticus]